MEDRRLLATFQVLNTLDDGSMNSLRWAIGQINARNGGDAIEFAIPGGGVQTIGITAALPDITEPVTLDGTKMPGYAGKPLVELDGTAAGPLVDGLRITGGGTTVVGLSIGNFSGNGINLAGLTGGNVVQNTYLGLRADGDTAAPNGINGLFVNSDNNHIGGIDPNQGNVVSGNLAYGINLSSADTNLLEGNLVGVNATETQKRGNTSGGIRVSLSLNNTIGGTTPTARNLVSGNSGPGIESFGVADGLVILGNVIGTDDTHSANLGNLQDGVRIFSDNATVGGLASGAGNIIAFNGDTQSSLGAGVAVILNVANNAILGNTIFSNAGLGIDLGGSGNQSQHSPTLSAASTDGLSTTVVGTLSGSDLNANYLIELYANDVSDPSGDGEGQIFLGRFSVMTDAAGNAPINFTVPVGVVPGQFITATATDPLGNTSEFATNIQVAGDADISVSLSPSPANPNVGDQVTYFLRVTNNGPTLARQVTAVVQIPGNTTLVQATSNDATVTIGPNTVTFNFGNLDSGKFGDATIVVQTSAASAPSIVASATVTSAEGDPAAGNNSTSVTTPINKVADLAVDVIGPATSVPVGQDITYTVTVNNNGPSAATGVTLIDTLPQNVSLKSASSTLGTISLNGNIITNDVGLLSANTGAVVLTIVVGTDGTTPLTITNSATVLLTESDPDTGNNTDAVTTDLTPVADLEISIADDPDPVRAGQNVTYSVTVTNHGPSAASTVNITDQLPTGATFVSASDNAGGTPVLANGSITDTIASLAPNASVVLTIVVQAPGVTTGSITDNASVTAAESDPNPNNNLDSETTTVTPVADLVATLVGTPGSVGAGQTVTYTATVTNTGPSPASNVTLVDTLPPNVTVQSVTISQGTTSQSTGTVTGNIGPLSVNATVTMTIVITTSGSNVPSIMDSVTATATEADPVLGNNTASTNTTVTPVADLAVTIAAPQGAVHVNDNVTYTVTATNGGPSPATNVTVTDTLPNGATFVSASDSLGNSLTPVNGVLTDMIGSLAASGTVTITIVVKANAVGQLIETATVAGSEADSSQQNNTSLVATSVSALSDLSLSLAADKTQVRRGDALTYTAAVVNNGPSAATGVTLSDQLPAGMTIVSLTPSQGNATSSNGQVTASFGGLAVGASATLTIVVIPSLAGPTTNTASVILVEDDAVSANNSATAGVDVLDLPGMLQFAVSSLKVNENARTASVVVTRTNGAQGQVSVNFATAGGTAVSGLDFRPVSGTLVFGQGETSKVISLPILANAHSKGDKTVRLNLTSPGGGASLGSRVSTTVVIHDLNPDFVAPKVLETRLAGTASSIQTISLFFSEGLDRAKASRAGNYQLFDVGQDGRFGTGDDRRLALQAPVYNATNNTVTLRPVFALGANHFYYVRATGLADLAGNALAAGAGGVPRAGYATYFARGTNLLYPDSRGAQVALRITGGGLIDLTRFANGEGERLQVLQPVPHRTVLTGQVAGGRGMTTLQSMTGLGVFGQVKVNMRTPPFVVAKMPFTGSILAPPAVDVVIGTGSLTARKRH